MNKQKKLMLLAAVACLSACNNPAKEGEEKKTVRLVTVAPGHFHAALVQKSMYPQMDGTVHVYAPEGSETDAHLALIDRYNTRQDDPTAWEEKVYRGDDFFQKMLSEKKGNMVVLAGNNRDKIGYIAQSVAEGLNVLADKPMVIDVDGFAKLKEAFAVAAEKDVLLYDIMTERYEISTMLQKAFAQQSEFFGGLVEGTADSPAITKESVHHFFKEVSGRPLSRPVWFYDTRQQGEGIVDVTTHLVDLVQWECFPEQVIDYERDIRIIGAKRWATSVTPEQFERSTGAQGFPDFLSGAVDGQGNLAVYANGEINYALKGVHAKVSVIWNFEAPPGAADLHYSIMRGRHANLIVQQGEAESYRPVLYAEPTGGRDAKAFEAALAKAVEQLAGQYKGLKAEPAENGRFRITVDPSLTTTHEDHFAQVTEKYLGFLQTGKMPDWEVPNMLAKYYLTTKALAEAE